MKQTQKCTRTMLRSLGANEVDVPLNHLVNKEKTSVKKKLYSSDKPYHVDAAH